MMLTHCGNNVRNRYSGCVFSVKDIVPVPLKTSRNHKVYVYALSGIGTRRRSALPRHARLPGYSELPSRFDQEYPHCL